FDLGKFWSNISLQRGDGVFWTIAVEFKYYLLIPIIAFAHLVLFKGRALRSALLIVAVAVGAAIAWRLPADESLNIVSLAPFLSIFLAGSLGAIVFHQLPPQPPARRRAASALALLAGAVAILLIPSVAETVFGMASAHQRISHWIVVWAVVWGVVVLF